MMGNDRSKGFNLWFLFVNHALDTSNVKIHTEVKVGRKDVVFEA